MIGNAGIHRRRLFGIVDTRGLRNSRVLRMGAQIARYNKSNRNVGATILGGWPRVAKQCYRLRARLAIECVAEVLKSRFEHLPDGVSFVFTHELARFRAAF